MLKNVMNTLERVKQSLEDNREKLSSDGQQALFNATRVLVSETREYANQAFANYSDKLKATNITTFFLNELNKSIQVLPTDENHPKAEVLEKIKKFTNLINESLSQLIAQYETDELAKELPKIKEGLKEVEEKNTTLNEKHTALTKEYDVLKTSRDKMEASLKKKMKKLKNSMKN